MLHLNSPSTMKHELSGQSSVSPHPTPLLVILICQQSQSKRRRTNASEETSPQDHMPLPSAASLTDSIHSALAAAAAATSGRKGMNQVPSPPQTSQMLFSSSPVPATQFSSTRKNLIRKFDTNATAAAPDDSAKRCNCKRSRCIKL